MKKNRVALTVKLPNALKIRLKTYAVRNNTRLSEVVEKAITAKLKRAEAEAAPHGAQ